MDVGEFLVRLVRYVIFFLALSKASYAGTIDPHTPDAQYVEFGKAFPWVVQIGNMIDCKKCGETHPQLASAVIIRPHWALTAAHVVQDAKEHYIKVQDKRHALTHVVWHKDFEENKVGWHDIALCYSPDDFGLKTYLPLYRKTDELGKAVTIAGWGSHGTFQTGAVKFDNNRRAGHNRVEADQLAILICRPSRPKKFPLEFMIGPGDSGGGLFIGNELAGINSFLSAADGKADGTYTDESAFTRISLYADWVELQIEKYENALQARTTTGADLELK